MEGGDGGERPKQTIKNIELREGVSVVYEETDDEDNDPRSHGGRPWGKQEAELPPTQQQLDQQELQQGQQPPRQQQDQQEEQQDQQPAQEQHGQQAGEEERQQRPPQEGAQQQRAGQQRQRQPGEAQQSHPQQGNKRRRQVKNIAQQGRFSVVWEESEDEDPDTERAENPEPEPEPEPPPGPEQQRRGEPLSSTPEVRAMEGEGEEEGREGRGGIERRRLGRCGWLYDSSFFFGGSDLELFCWYMRHTIQAKSTHQHIEIMKAAHFTGRLCWDGSNDLFLAAERESTAIVEAAARRLYTIILTSASCLRISNQAITDFAVFGASRA